MISYKKRAALLLALTLSVTELLGTGTAVFGMQQNEPVQYAEDILLEEEIGEPDDPASEDTGDAVPEGTGDMPLEAVVCGLSENKCGDNVYWSFDEGTLTIYGSGGMYDYVDDFPPYYMGKNYFEAECIVIKGTVRYIGKYAFENARCSQLTLEEGVEQIGEGAFARARIPAIIIPYSVTRLDEFALGDTDSDLIMIPGSISEISAKALQFASADTIVLGEGVKALDKESFSNSMIEDLYLPLSVESMEERAFHDGMYISMIHYAGTEEEFKSILKGAVNQDLDDTDFEYNAPSPPLCTVSFDSAGGSFVGMRYVVKGRSLGNGSSIKTEKDGAVFLGWYTDPGLTQEIDLKNTSIETDMVIYAGWRDKYTYYMHFIAGGEEVALLPVTEGGSFEFEDVSLPVREGMVMDGWYSDERCRGSRIQNLTSGYSSIFQEYFFYGRWMDERSPRHFRVEQRLRTQSGTMVLAIDYDYTDTVVYDGRKHVLAGLGQVSGNKVSADIYIKNFSVTLDDVSINGIGIKKAKYKNNRERTTYFMGSKRNGERYMYIGLDLSYDIKAYPEYEKLYKALRPILKMMAAPRLYWENNNLSSVYDYPEVIIMPITVSSDTPVYTWSQYRADPGLSQREGIFIWDGISKTIWNKNYRGFTLKPVKVTLKGLTYQYGVTMGDGSRAIRQIKLQPGIWKYREYGEDNTSEDVYPYKADYKLNYYSDLSKGDRTVKIYPGFGRFDGTFPEFVRSEDDISSDKR